MFHQAAIPSVPRSLADPVASHEANATGTLKLLREAQKAGVRRVGLRGVLVGLWRYADAAQDRDDAAGAAVALRGLEAGRRALLPACSRARRPGDGKPPLLQRVRSASGSDLQYAAVIPNFMTAALAGGEPTVFGDGKQSRDFCFIDNTVDANLSASRPPRAGVSGKVFNVACGTATSLNDGGPPHWRYSVSPVSVSYSPSRVGDVKHSLADISAARAAFGYEGAISFVEGLRRTIEWYASGTRGSSRAAR